MTKKPICPMCNGKQAIITLTESKICDCYYEEMFQTKFQKLFAPSGMNIRLKDLPLNPNIQSKNKLGKIKEELGARFNQLNQEEVNEVLNSTISDMQTTMKKILDTPFLYQETNENGMVIEKGLGKDVKILFTGDTGRGKTQTALSLAIEIAMKHDKKVAFLSMHSIKNLFYFDFSSQVENERVTKQKQMIRDADILVIDDLAKELDVLKKERGGLDALRQAITMLDETLRMKERLFIITSNVQKSELYNEYSQIDQRFASVLFNEGSFQSFQFIDEIRSKVKKQDFDW